MRIKKILSSVLALAFAFSFATVTATTASAESGTRPPSTPTSWFEYNKKTGGWIVNDISRAANNGEAQNVGRHGHRVQLTPFDTLPEDMPPPSGHEILLKLPEFDSAGDKCDFQSIEKIRVTYTVDWVNWNKDERMDFKIIVQNTINDWAEFEEGGVIGNILSPYEGEDGEIEDMSVVPKTVVMEAEPVMSKFNPLPPPGSTTLADFMVVMVTNYAIANKVDDVPRPFPPPPITAEVEILDHNGQVLKLVCPDCEKSPCECTCDVCGKLIAECTCTEYDVVSGFPNWNGSGTATVAIDANKDKFDRLKNDGVLVDEDDYAVTENDAGHTVITIRESYLKKLDNKKHNFTAFFSTDDSEVAKFSIEVANGNTTPSTTAPSSSTTAPSSSTTAASGTTTTRATTTTARNNNDTNPRTGVAIVFLPAIIAAGAVAATTKSRKKK